MSSVVPEGDYCCCACGVGFKKEMLGLSESLKLWCRSCWREYIISSR